MNTPLATVIVGVSILIASCSSGTAPDAGTDAANAVGGAAGTAAGPGDSGGSGGLGGASGSAGDSGFTGSWTFTERLTDQGVGVQCTDQGTWTLTQTGAAIDGQDTQTGTCVYTDGTVTDNADSEAISNGSVNGTSIMFTEAGAIPCIYTGTASGSPPTSMSGTISCVGTFQGTAYNTTGTWQATKQ